MQFKAIQVYILPGEPMVREVDGSRVSMEQQLQSWTGMFTHTHSLRGSPGQPTGQAPIMMKGSSNG